MHKKVFLWVLVFLITISTLIAVPNFVPKVRALAPEVEGKWIDDPSCGPGGWRCYESPCHKCWCRDVDSGACCH